MFIKLLLLAFCGLFAATVQAWERYGSSCWACSLVPDISTVWLQCTCTTESAQAVSTSINLNPCFVDNNGQLQAAQNGNFFSSCADFSLGGTTGTVLNANCKDYYGNWQSTWVDMYYSIGNINGQLMC